MPNPRDNFENLLDNFTSSGWIRDKGRSSFCKGSCFASIRRSNHTGRHYIEAHFMVEDALAELGRDLEDYEPRYVVDLVSGIAYRAKISVDLGEPDKSLVNGYGGEG